jgi:hypothetical protein
MNDKAKFRKPVDTSTEAKQKAEDAFIAAADAVAPVAPRAPGDRRKRGAAKPSVPPVQPPAAQPEELELSPPPWDGVNPDVAKHVNLKFDGVTHAKMVWITNNVPQMKSHQKLIEACLFDFIEGLLAKHYTPPTVKVVAKS